MTLRNLPLSRNLLAYAAAILLALIHMSLFTSGYRMSADDAAFVETYMKGGAAVLASAQGDAQSQGRIGAYVMKPLNIVAAYYSGNFGFRLATVALYFSLFLLMSDFISRIARVDIRSMLFAAFLALHPLAFEHMPPNAYPLQNTLPMFLILLCRIVFLMRQGRNEGQWSWLRLLVAGLLVVCMFESEYALIFGVSLMLAEYAWLVSHVRVQAGSWRAALRAVARNRALWVDAASVLLVLTVYLAYRWHFPSSYDGNSPDGISRPERVLATMIAHAVSGTLFLQIDMRNLVVPWRVVAMALATGLLVLVCYRSNRSGTASLTRAGRIGLVATGFFGALISTVPLAVTKKHQMWCLDAGECGFLDSRIAYLWVIVALVGAILWLAASVPMRWKQHVFTGSGLLIAVCSAAAFANNWRQAKYMADISSAWKKADLLACYTQKIPASNADLARLVDPGHRVMMHPDISVGEYWRRYVQWGAAHLPCPLTSDERQLAYLDYVEGQYRLRIGQKLRFARSGDSAYLAEGWSPESWGVWSVGPQATVKVNFISRQYLLMTIAAVRYGPDGHTKPVGILWNGNRIATLQMRKDLKSYSVRVPVAALAADGETNALDFLIEDAISPREDGSGIDNRKLGIGLVSMVFEPAAGQ